MMKKKIKVIAWLAVFFVIAAAGVAIYLKTDLNDTPDDGRYKIDEARIESIRQMVSLCTLEINEEVAFKDSINGKWLVVREKIRGRVKYDLDSLKIEQRGDTLLVYLPKESVEIRENESPDSYEILDFWDGDNMIFTRNITAEEENILKRRWRGRLEQKIRDRGYLVKARENASSVLMPIFRSMRGASGDEGPVILVE